MRERGWLQFPLPVREVILRLPVFDREHKKYMVWWTHFETYAGCFGFLEALEEDPNMPLTSKT
jgi:hypothetical protein